MQFSRSTSVAGEEYRDEQEDGERTLTSWPPKSSLHKTSGGHTGKLSIDHPCKLRSGQEVANIDGASHNGVKSVTFYWLIEHIINF